MPYQVLTGWNTSVSALMTVSNPAAVQAIAFVDRTQTNRYLRRIHAGYTDLTEFNKAAPYSRDIVMGRLMVFLGDISPEKWPASNPSYLNADSDLASFWYPAQSSSAVQTLVPGIGRIILDTPVYNERSVDIDIELAGNDVLTIVLGPGYTQIDTNAGLSATNQKIGFLGVYGRNLPDAEAENTKIRFR